MPPGSLSPAPAPKPPAAPPPPPPLSPLPHPTLSSAASCSIQRLPSRTVQVPLASPRPPRPGGAPAGARQGGGVLARPLDRPRPAQVVPAPPAVAARPHPSLPRPAPLVPARSSPSVPAKAGGTSCAPQTRTRS
ncbi:hypothetical protein GQ55_4G076500 [Panicum hallii var. hallii]|uniref:Uncharacterized protein n=1 Tax=Panicum hallii var. hallii TaxID=1504633 RepID=A0A2T7DWB3_9POAL|nr:hypothetical protein GQ55_4G076500 [Panicum hallii var. hallii]